MAEVLVFMQSITIAFIITGLSTGGAEMMLYKLLSHMDKERFNPVVISLSDKGTLGGQIESLGIQVLTIGMKPGLPTFNGMRRLFRYVYGLKPDILQGWMYHGNLAAQIAGIFTARGVPVIWNVRQSLYSLKYEKKGTAFVIKAGSYLSRFPKKIIYNAKTSAEQHEALGYCVDNRLIIPNGFNTNDFSPSVEARNSVRSELKISKDAILVGLIGRYHPMKDHSNFFQAASLLIKRHPQAYFVLAGRQVDFANEHLRQIINDLNISENVRLLGERRDIPRLMAALDIASSSSSHAEGFANVIGEAMSCGVPCVVTNVGDSAFIVGDIGKVVPPRDPVVLATAWSELIEMGEDSRKKLGLKARQRIIDNFSLEKVVKKYEELYIEVMSSTNRTN
ncbi:MAG: glycosyltransferase [Nitrospirota bacterium]